MHKQNFRKDSLFFSLSLTHTHTHTSCVLMAWMLDVKSAPLRKRWSVGFCDFLRLCKFERIQTISWKDKEEFLGAVVCHCWGDRIESTHL